MLSDLEIARREREIIENLERSEQLKQQQQQQRIWERQQEDTGAGELDEHLQYQEVGGTATIVTFQTCLLPLSSCHDLSSTSKM